MTDKKTLNLPPSSLMPREAVRPQPKIKQVTTNMVNVGSSQQAALIFGLGKDGKMYQWMGDQAAWVLA